MKKAIIYQDEKFIVNMVTGTVKRQFGEFLLKDNPLKEEIIKLAYE